MGAHGLRHSVRSAYCLSTRETVACETPANRATSWLVTAPPLFSLPEAIIVAISSGYGSCGARQGKVERGSSPQFPAMLLVVE